MLQVERPLRFRSISVITLALTAENSSIENFKSPELIYSESVEFNPLDATYTPSFRQSLSKLCQNSEDSRPRLIFLQSGLHRSGKIKICLEQETT